jgi:hypothetical protein
LDKLVLETLFSSLHLLWYTYRQKLIPIRFPNPCSRRGLFFSALAAAHRQGSHEMRQLSQPTATCPDLIPTSKIVIPIQATGQRLVQPAR